MTMDDSGATFFRFQCDVRNWISKMSISVAVSRHLQCCSHFITKHLGLAFNKYCISL